MIIESGVIIFLGFLFLFIKLPRRTVLWALGFPITLDVGFSALAYILHWGSYSGVLSAAVAGLMVSTMTSLSRYAVGYIDRGKYYPGHFADWRKHAVK